MTLCTAYFINRESLRTLHFLAEIFLEFLSELQMIWPDIPQMQGNIT